MTSRAAALDLVLLNGWGMSAAAWQPLERHLAASVAPRAIDLPGYGAAPHVAPCDGVHLAAFVARVAPPRCAVLAWSLGAQVALQWASACPSQVQRLVLIGATPCFVEREGWPCAMPRAVFDRFAADVASDARAALARFALLQAQGEAKTATVARTLRAACAVVSLETLHGGLAVLQENDLRDMLGGVKAPALIVHGERDALVPVDAARTLHAGLPDARLRVLPGAGHAPHVSQPEAVATLLAEFLNER
jgi:pimeloyl-[acyl-carrier protein] methyl ester esterase